MFELFRIKYYFEMRMTHGHIRGLSARIMAAGKSSQLGLFFFFAATLEKHHRPIYYYGCALRCRRLKNKIKNELKLIYTSDTLSC